MESLVSVTQAAGSAQVRWLDRPAPYVAVWRAMRDFTASRNAATDDELWLVEHQPVYTLGQAADASHVLNPGGIPVVHCDRGGQVTYHGPGQVVMYTLVDLRRKRVFVRDFVRLLEQTVLDALWDLGVQGAMRLPGSPGVFVPQSALLRPDGTKPAKVAALGVKVHRGCAYHGMALNVAMDEGPFLGINPCGYAGLRTVDLRACGVDADFVRAGELLAGAFARLWREAGFTQEAICRR